MRMMARALSLSSPSVPDLQAGHSRLYLCRHGETESNALKLLQGSGVDSPLNSKGHEQASALAQSLRSIRLDHVGSSTLSRAVATADSIASAQASRQGAINRIKDAEFVEMSYGSLEGLPISDVRPKLAELNEAWAAGRTDVRVGGDGESPDQLLSRAQAALWQRGLMGSLPVGTHVAVVAHRSAHRPDAAMPQVSHHSRPSSGVLLPPGSIPWMSAPSTKLCWPRRAVLVSGPSGPSSKPTAASTSWTTASTMDRWRWWPRT